MQEDRINNNAAANPVEVWDGWAQGSEPRGVEAGVAQPLARGFARNTGAQTAWAGAYLAAQVGRPERRAEQRQRARHIRHCPAFPDPAAPGEFHGGGRPGCGLEHSRPLEKPHRFE